MEEKKDFPFFVPTIYTGGLGGGCVRKRQNNFDVAEIYREKVHKTSYIILFYLNLRRVLLYARIFAIVDPHAVNTHKFRYGQRPRKMKRWKKTLSAALFLVRCRRWSLGVCNGIACNENEDKLW